ncbi:MAG: V-type ATP synthase subunit F [Nitrososphaeria archaeon]
MGKVYVIGDEILADFFKVAGAREVIVPKNKDEARKSFLEYLQKEDAVLIIVETKLSSWISDLIKKHLSDRNVPLVMTISSSVEETYTKQKEAIATIIKQIAGMKME